MTNNESTKEAAIQLFNEYDETALEVLIALRDKEVKKNPSLGDDPNLTVHYEENTMAFERLKAIGKEIMRTWNHKLYGLFCGNTSEDQTDRKQLMDALKIGSGAIIGVITSALTTTFMMPAALAAVVAALVVKRFILPAGQAICDGWKERIGALN